MNVSLIYLVSTYVSLSVSALVYMDLAGMMITGDIIIYEIWFIPTKSHNNSR